jgi:hypothetical protein
VKRLSFRALFDRYSYNTFRLLLNQFAVAIFAAVLSMVALNLSDGAARAVSVFSIAFYLFLAYSLMWETGSKDRVSYECHKLERFGLRGVIMALIAGIPNFILAAIYAVGYPQMAVEEWAGNLCAITKILMSILEGMYMGLLTTVPVGDTFLHDPSWVYFVIPIPAILMAGLGYVFGFHNLHVIPAKPKKKEPFDGEKPHLK